MPAPQHRSRRRLFPVPCSLFPVPCSLVITTIFNTNLLNSLHS
ncbi:MAG: hypothetical protein ACK57T_08695 [Dolichospermum sp.]